MNVLLLSLLLPRAVAGEAVDLGGKAYLRYSVDLTEGAGFDNAFALDRVYLTARSRLDGAWRFRVTLDVGREKTATVDVTDSAGDVATVEVPGDEHLQAFLKYGYLERSLPVEGVRIRAGMSPTAWIGYGEHFWGKRWVSKTLTDRVKLQSSSDLGIQLLGRHADGLVEWQAELINGEGYAHPEVDASKTAQARVDLNPVRGEGGHLTLGVFGAWEWVPGAPDAATWAGAAGYAMPWFLAWAEAAGRFEGSTASLAWSVVLEPRIPDVLDVFVRYDEWDPDLDAADDRERRLLAGLAHPLASAVDLGLDYERSWTEASPATPEHVLSARAQVRF